MINLNVNNENDPLEIVVLGTHKGFSLEPPQAAACYDPKSKESVSLGIYPTKKDIKAELDAVESIFNKYQIEVIRPKKIQNYNQIFARDVAFVIEDKLVCSNIIPERENEIFALQHKLINKINPKKLLNLPEDSHIEGGDVVLYNDYVFVGTYRGKDYAYYKTARTNYKAIRMLREYFPQKKIIALELCKHNEDPRENILHLDCCFQPVGKRKAILYKKGFIHQEDVNYIENLFGEENIVEVSQEEMYQMNTNVLSISPGIVISDERFIRLNDQLIKWDIKVEEVSYREVSKMGGLLRCTTMPLKRKK